MKKATLQYLVDLMNYRINQNGGEAETDTVYVSVRDELTAELSKGKAKADANRALYDEIRDAVVEALRSATAPVTAQELADETGYAKGKIVYGLTNYWSDLVVKIEGKTNTYTLKGEDA